VEGPGTFQSPGKPEDGRQQPQDSNPEASVLLSPLNPLVPRPWGGVKGTGVEGPGTFQSPGKLDRAVWMVTLSWCGTASEEPLGGSNKPPPG